LDNFYQNCDQISDTITLIETEYGKKIGGFTSLKWEKNVTPSTKNLPDANNTTFVFSLTNN
jgi:hypothetical protein